MRSRGNYWIRNLNSSRLSRRRFVGATGAATAGAAGLALVGCGDDDDGGNGGPTATATSGGDGGGDPTATPDGGGGGGPTPGGTVRFTSANNTWDIFDADRSRFTPFGVLLGYCNQGIVQYKSFLDAELEGGFASEWEQVDDTTMTFTLREGTTWHDKPPVDGRAATVEDMKYFIERNRDGLLLDGTSDINFYRNAQYQTVETVEAVDASTLRVTFSQVNPFFLGTLAGTYSKVQAPEAVEAFEADYVNLSGDHIIGTGAYVMTEFDPAGEIALDKFEGFTASDVYIDGIDYVALFTDQAAQQTAFEQKQIDAFAPQQVAVLEELQGRLEGQVYTENVFAANPQAGTYFGGTEPWSNQNLIGAIYRAFDRRQLIQQIVQGRASMYGNIPPTQQPFNIGERQLITLGGYLEDREADLTEANAMWQAGGGPELGEIIIDIPDIYDGLYGAASIITTQLNTALNTNQFSPVIEPYSTITGKLIDQSYGNGNNNIWYGWISDVTALEPTLGLYQSYNSAQPQFFQFGVTIPEVDDLTNQAVSELDVATRQDLCHQIETLLIQNYGAGIPGNLITISQTMRWNYYHSTEAAPFVTAHQFGGSAYIDSNDPTYEGRPA